MDKDNQGFLAAGLIWFVCAFLPMFLAIVAMPIAVRVFFEANLAIIPMVILVAVFYCLQAFFHERKIGYWTVALWIIIGAFLPWVGFIFVPIILYMMFKFDYDYRQEQQSKDR